MTPTDQAELLAKLYNDTRVPPAELVHKKGQFDYVGHADATALLLEHDPCWSWEPFAVDDHGLPKVMYDAAGKPRALWIRLTIHGLTRIGIGTCSATAGDPYKELIGDAIRNAALRFGVALSLWSTSEWTDGGGGESQSGERTPKESRGSAPKDNAPRTGKTRQAKSNDGVLLRQDQAIAARAQALGLDDATRVDVIRALTGKTSGKDIEVAQVTQVMRNMQWLVDGFVQLEYDPDGIPSLVDTHAPNPGPP